MGLLKLFKGKETVPVNPETPLFFHNTLTNEKEAFSLPEVASYVRMYNCGPTVYGRQHIGNLSMFVFTDVIRRTLEYNGYTVKQVINFTDVGHLVSDGDDGEDKMTKGLKREHMELTLENMRTLAERYAGIFIEDLQRLNIDTSRIEFPRASDYIPAQIAMIKALEDKSYAYATKDGVYFDTAQFKDYGKLGGINIEELKEGARVEANPEKRNPTDFALWKFNKKMGWESPWGKGFPGWHIECSAMIRACLGEKIDIHTGGIEHIPIHHNNEIAQSEGATGKKPLSRFWMHRAHIQIEGGKIAKSGGNVIYLAEEKDSVVEKGFHPLALRYLFLGAHYRTPMNFSWASLEAAQTAFLRLRRFVDTSPEGGTVPENYRTRWHERFNDDLDTPGAFAVLWDMIKDSSLSPADIRAGILDADAVFGLALDGKDAAAEQLFIQTYGVQKDLADIPEEIQQLVAERERARNDRDFDKADELRKELLSRGYEVKDTPQGSEIFQK